MLKLKIMFAKFNASFIQQDVELGYMAKVTQGFSGADLTEICQRVIFQFLLYIFWAFPFNQLLASIYHGRSLNPSSIERVSYLI